MILPGVLLSFLVGVIFLPFPFLEDALTSSAHHLLNSIPRHMRPASLVGLGVVLVNPVASTDVQIASETNGERMILRMLVQGIQ